MLEPEARLPGKLKWEARMLTTSLVRFAALLILVLLGIACDAAATPTQIPTPDPPS